MSSIDITGLDPATKRPIRVTCEHGLITAIEPGGDETDLYLSPGFIDMQVNGYAGFDLNSELMTVQTVVGLVEALLANGVTCFIPTVITSSEESICHAVSVIADARKVHARVAACVPFVHVEGPHISPIEGYRGAHPGDFVRPPSIAEFDRWQSASGGCVGMVTLSPHFEESVDYIRALIKRGVHVAIGHTHASPEQIKGAVDAGARLSTHLGNGITEVIARHRNPIWAQLADDRLSATFIADGHHLPTDVLKSMLAAKGIERSILVSDSVALAGMPAGHYSTAIGGKVELRTDGRLCVAGSDYLAGSTACLPQCIENVVLRARIPLDHALRMATLNPGAFTGKWGQIALGAGADIVRFRFNHHLIVTDVWLAGKSIQQSSGHPGKASLQREIEKSSKPAKT